jgi:electron transfer flavoprotein alpha subunit
MLAIIPVRDGVLPAGAAEAACEAGTALVVGSGSFAAATELTAYIADVAYADVSIQPHRLTAWLALADLPERLILPGSPDGRDIAPVLALRLRRPLFAGALEVDDDRVRLARQRSTVIEQVKPTGPFVATLIPGGRGVARRAGDEIVPAPFRQAEALVAGAPAVPPADAESIEVLPPNAATMDLVEAKRIVGGGAGLDSEQRLCQLAEVAALLDASMGATRVVTDRGWAGHERQIGTTGVVVNPALYVAFGVSGAVQHTSGLGTPEHIISVNTDPHCPMMQLADLAIVADANETLDALGALLTVADAPRPAR